MSISHAHIIRNAHFYSCVAKILQTPGIVVVGNGNLPDKNWSHKINV